MIETTSLSDKIYDYLKEKIINLDLKPGEKINYDEISSELNISKTPLRDALKQLSNDGFVVIKPRSETRVYIPNAKSINDIYDVRHSIELLALEKSIDNIHKNDIKNMLKKIEKSNELILNENYQHYFKVDREIHALWIQNSNNDHIIKILESLEGHIHWFSVLSTVYKTRPIESNEEYKAILNSILHGDHDKAKELLSIHIIGSQQIQLKEFGNMNENFMTNK